MFSFEKCLQAEYGAELLRLQARIMLILYRDAKG